MGDVTPMKAPKVKVPKIPGLNRQVNIPMYMTAPEFILGLDVSLEHTGWALCHVASGDFNTGVFEPNPSASKKVVQKKGMERLVWLRRNVLGLAKYGSLSPVLCDPTGDPYPDSVVRAKLLVIIEGYAFGAKGASGINLGELGGVIRVGFYDEKIPYIEIPPTQLKKFITGKGTAPKEIMLKEVLKRYAFDTDDNNVADAYSLMQLGRAITDKHPEPLLVHQREVVADVVKTYFKEHPIVAAA